MSEEKNELLYSGYKDLIIDQSGNVGIGTDNPTEKLEVNGIIKAKGIKIPNIIFGNINENGTINTGEGFTSTRQAEGKYTITFDTPFLNKPAVQVTQIYPDIDNSNNTDTGNIKDNAVVFGLYPDYFFCSVGGAEGTPRNRDFSFIATGFI